MNEDDYGYDSNGSDIDTWEDEQVFQDHEGEEEQEEPIFFNHFQTLVRTMEKTRK